jgi:hypothetical protein
MDSLASFFIYISDTSKTSPLRFLFFLPTLYQYLAYSSFDEKCSSQCVWSVSLLFKPVLLFLYSNAPVFSSFRQELELNSAMERFDLERIDFNRRGFSATPTDKGGGFSNGPSLLSPRPHSLSTPRSAVPSKVSEVSALRKGRSAT